MRRRPLIWLAISLACFIGAYYFWQHGERRATEKRAPVVSAAPEAATNTENFSLVTRAGNLNASSTPDPELSPTNRAMRFAYRLRNTEAPIGELAHVPTAVLLENALLDTRLPVELQIPEQLRASEEPGAWIVQARGETTPEFRAKLAASGATIISYIPNNAYLVTASKGVAEGLRDQAQAVLPYEPYYKLKSTLLRTAAQMSELPENTRLRVLLFSDHAADTVEALAAAGAEVTEQTTSPFGPIVTIRPQPTGLPEIARMPGVQLVELARERIPANDLSRVAIAISTNTITTENYLGLTGTNVVVNVNDTGIDAAHPDLANRVFADPLFSADLAFMEDRNGHGTHVAGIIASSGAQSETVTNASGSVLPPVAGQFRGKAPGAKLFSMPFTAPDVYLQQTAARTNAYISNNSWQFRSAFEYDLGAASYDAAVRDALPTVPGSQPLVYVFAAGNSGGGSHDGASGSSDSIVSPGTAKNVITVGAVEQLRNITNETWECEEFFGELFCETNKPWLGETDSEDEIASFSSRGNVGVSIEGEKGRFKPDVVAPGSMVVSTKSGQWDIDTYYNNTNYSSQVFPDLVLGPRELWQNTIFVPANAVEMSIRVQPGRDATFPFPDMPIYVRQGTAPTNTPGGYDVMGFNEVVLPRDYPLSPTGQGWRYAIGNNTSNMVSFTVSVQIAQTNSSNFNEVLKAMNDGLGPYYRYESGASMAAAQVSGTLALMQEFFEQRLNKTNSPALMKALLINGSRPINSEIYDLHVRTDLNSQGWGQVNITNTLHGALADPELGDTSSLLYFDQSPDTALVTGAKHTYPVTVSPEGESDPIRITLVWTDPPGNPAASIKLVNDLDLIVTNLSTGEVYFGNDIPEENLFNVAWDTNRPPEIDVVNNVENVFLPGYSGTNWSITVVGRAVNVNAVTAHTNDVAQDYALVISCGDGYATNGLTLGTITSVAETTPLVTVVTNAFEGNPDYSGNVLYGQHAGASTPLLGTNQIAAPVGNGVITLGMTNQWHFYAISNIFGFTNAAFMTFIPPNLALPRMGATEFEVENASRVEADVDMYVSTDPNLTNLAPSVVDQAIKSLGRNGTETIILSNAVPGMYYIGIKAEDQQAAEYVFAGIFSRFPFSEEDALGNQHVRGFPVPQAIPDASLNSAGRIIPGQAQIMAFSMGPDLVRRVIVTNSMAHELTGDLIGRLSHGAQAATLNNHTTNLPAPPSEDLIDGLGRFWPAYIYDDSGENNVPFAHQSDGPGTLEVFGGREGAGQWLFTQSDGAVTHTGTNGPFFMFIEKQPDLEEGIVVTLEPGACRRDFVRVPAEATNLTIEVSILSGVGPVSVQVCPLDEQIGCESTTITNGIGGSVTIDILDDPPLKQGVYSVRTCNLGTEQVTVRILARIYRGSIIQETVSNSSGPVTVQDDSITYAYITNLTDMRISSLDLSLIFNHPRISDLAITLISPNGTRVLLFEDRGGLTSEGMGTLTATTNGLGEVIYYYTTMKPFYTNGFDRAAIGLYAPGSSFQGWSVLTNYATVLEDWSAPWLENNILSLEDSTVHLDLPTTNATDYTLTFQATHAPYITGTVGWWPFEGDGRDISGGFDGLMIGGGNTTNYSMFSTGQVYNAFYGDAVRTSVMVPAAPELDVAKSGFTVEGWIYPLNRSLPDGWFEGFENFPSKTVFSPTTIGDWRLTAGSIDVLSFHFGGSAHSGNQYIDICGYSGATLIRDLTLVPQKTYRLSVAYTRNPDRSTFSPPPRADIRIGGNLIGTVEPGSTNSWPTLGWRTASFVFTATDALTTLAISSPDTGAYGVLLDTIRIEPDGIKLAEDFDSWPNAIFYSPTNYAGWSVTSGSVDITTPIVGRPLVAFSGTQCLDLNGWGPGKISRSLDLTVGEKYNLSFAYARNADNPDNINPTADVSIDGVRVATLTPQGTNTWSNLNWSTTSIVFTASSPQTALTFEGISAGPSGVLIDSLSVQAEGVPPDTAPLVEWVDRSNNVAGVQFWVSGLSWTNPQPGALVAAFGTNGTQVISTPTNALTTRRWQHVALSYDAVLREARLYTNGQVAAVQPVPADLVPVTGGDLFFGFHPSDATNVASFKGGIDEFGLYRRPLSDCEINAIFNAGALGKYGTNALTCPIAYELTLTTDTTTVLTITNGLSWTNGPSWELNSISFTNPVLSAVTNGPGTNLAGITIRPLTPNVALDNFVLYRLSSNQVSGALQFTENTNLALLPIKFAPTPYSISNFPPTSVFTNNFISASEGVYAAGESVPGLDPVAGRDWLVTTGSVSVISNRLFNPGGTNSLVLGQAKVESTLPTVPGHRYELTYTIRGPGAVGWWTGELEPLSGRARDLIGGNHGALVNGATNMDRGFITEPNAPDTALAFGVGEYNPTNPYPVVARSPRVELSDPANLRLTNALTIEGWIFPRNTQTNFDVGVGTVMQQIFYRGDGRDCLDPYYLALYYHPTLERYDVVFHVEDATGVNCGFNLFTTNAPVEPNLWQHVGAVFEANVPVEGAPPGPDGQPQRTNQVTIYLDGQRVAQAYTAHAPFADLDPSFTPGVSIGNRSRYSRLTEAFTDAQPFYGFIDDLAVYGRALSEAEIVGIHDRSVLGKGDLTVPPSQALAKARVSVDGVQLDFANGENDRFTTRTVYFTAIRTNATVLFEGLLPGTVIEGLHLSEIPAELNYLPEESLKALIGESAYGVWTLEIWDTRAGGSLTNDILQLLDWRMNFQLAPTNPVPVITLRHGIPHQGLLLGHAVQHFIVPVPQWATNATNVLLWATNRVTALPGEVGVLFDGTNQAPADIANALFWPPANSGTVVLFTNTVSPFIVPGQNYYLTVTNPSPQPVTFAYGVWFDIETLTNCQPTVALANPAGIPKYFQFDVPAPGDGETPREVVLSMTGMQSNLTLVVSQNLPLPDLGNYDYISRRPSTNDQVIMVLTNSTPYPLTEGRWYAGVFNSQWTNVPFTIQVCYATDAIASPRIIPLTNDVPFIAGAAGEFAAPPGPPKWLFFELDLTNSVDAILFELYNLTGDADMIVQREVPSGMAPYFDGSFRLGTEPEAVVVRVNRELGDLRGKWYVGVYNNESTNVGYTVRATLPDSTGLLNSALPLMLRLVNAAGPHGIVLEWNSIPGEVYYIEYSPSMFPVNWQPFPMAQPIIATTLKSAVELPIGTSGRAFYRVRHDPRGSVLVPPMSIRIEPDGRLRVSWPSTFPDLVVQSTTNLGGGPWINANVQIVEEGSEFAFYYEIGPGQRFFRLIAQ